jgi:hypothetical protein
MTPRGSNNRTAASSGDEGGIIANAVSIAPGEKFSYTIYVRTDDTYGHAVSVTVDIDPELVISGNSSNVGSCQVITHIATCRKDISRYEGLLMFVSIDVPDVVTRCGYTAFATVRSRSDTYITTKHTQLTLATRERLCMVMFPILNN